jgi:ssDNA-binding Zn-finger/Zn-ribbon topoisomerase 1
MGWSYGCRCNSCGLHAVVSGRRDRGFYVETETRYCPHRETLADVGVSLWSKALLPGLLPPDRIDGLLRAEQGFDLCPKCQRPGGRPWVAGSPCPKCGGSMQAVEGEFVQWI